MWAWVWNFWESHCNKNSRRKSIKRKKKKRYPIAWNTIPIRLFTHLPGDNSCVRREPFGGCRLNPYLLIQRAYNKSSWKCFEISFHHQSLGTRDDAWACFLKDRLCRRESCRIIRWTSVRLGKSTFFFPARMFQKDFIFSLDRHCAI